MPPNEPSLSAEIGLLERLAESELSLTVAVTLFPRVDRAKRAVELCIRSEVVELICKRDGDEAVVQPWRLRFVLNDPGTWDADNDGAFYHLRLTAAAQERYVSDSQGLIEDVFQSVS
ncbi:MAG TPA: hypothetical protein VFI31_29970 [Pirellulales bacterium]|nr:hypothetical protein [Pirellulales bacterium]